MYTLLNNEVTFSYTFEVLQQHLQEISAQLSLTLTPPSDDLSAPDAYALTADENTTVALLLQESAVTAADEFDKMGRYWEDNGSFFFSAPCPDGYERYARQADNHLQEWLVWHTLTRWLRIRHLDKPASWTLLQATVAFSALHKSLFQLRACR